MDFTALDFETATSCYSSVCSVGLCTVENGRVKERKEIFVRPEPFVFNDYNIKIHGIHPEAVENCGNFDYYKQEIFPYLDGKIVVAHNAQFDVGVLRAVCDQFNIEYPTFNYLCTVKLSQKAYPELPSHKLNAISEAMGIKFNHHDACEDAYACAEVLLRIMKDFNLNSLEEIEKKFEIGIGKLYPGYYEPCRKNKKKDCNKTTKK